MHYESNIEYSRKQTRPMCTIKYTKNAVLSHIIHSRSRQSAQSYRWIMIVLEKSILYKIQMFQTLINQINYHSNIVRVVLYNEKSACIKYVSKNNLFAPQYFSFYTFSVVYRKIRIGINDIQYIFSCIVFLFLTGHC